MHIMKSRKYVLLSLKLSRWCTRLRLFGILSRLFFLDIYEAVQESVHRMCIVYYNTITREGIEN